MEWRSSHVRLAHFGPKPSLFHQLGGGRMVWVSVFPVRRKNECWFDLTENFSKFSAVLQSRFKAAIGQPEIASPGDPQTSGGFVRFTLADFRSFVDAQRRVDIAYQDKDRWTKMSILNCAASGKFSTDRTITEYNDDIWKLPAIAIDNNF